MMPTFYFIPKAVLGSVIITAVWPMIEFHELISLWRGRSNNSSFKKKEICLLFFFNYCRNWTDTFYDHLPLLSVIQYWNRNSYRCSGSLTAVGVWVEPGKGHYNAIQGIISTTLWNLIVQITIVLLKQEGNEERIVLTMDRNLYYPSVERFRNSLTKVSKYNTAPNRTIVIDMIRVTQIDHTSLKVHIIV